MAWIEFKEQRIYNTDQIVCFSLGNVGEYHGYDTPTPAVFFLIAGETVADYVTFKSAEGAENKYKEIKQILMDNKD